MREKYSFLMSLLVGLIWCLFAVPFSVHAGTTGKIAGVVSSKTSGEGLPGANVVIEGTTLGASADSKGYYFILHVPPGVYVVKTTMMGYTALRKTNIKVVVDHTTEVNFELEPTVLEAGAIITVIGEREVVPKDLTASQQVAETAEIINTPVTDLTDFIDNLAGVSEGHFRGGGSGVWLGAFTEDERFAGKRNSEQIVQVDGMVLRNPFDFSPYIAINRGMIKQLEVLTGGFNAEYGEAQSGIINIVTPEGGRKISGRLDYRYRPAQVKHWGRPIYDDSRWERKKYDNLEFWEAPNERNPSKKNWEYYYGAGSPGERLHGIAATNAKEAWDFWRSEHPKRKYILPDHEVEMTLFGPVSKKLDFMLSSRYSEKSYILPRRQSLGRQTHSQLKLTHRFSPNLKLTFGGFFGYLKTIRGPEFFGGDYNFRGWHWRAETYDQSRDFSYFEQNYQGYVAFTHVLSPNTFYELKLSRYHNDTWTKLAPEYVINGRLVPDSEYDYPLANPAGAWAIRDDKYTNWRLDADFISQVHSNHLIKSGLEFEYNALNRNLTHGAGSESAVSKFAKYPIGGAIYMQDKMEFEGLIVNWGLRYDWFRMSGNYISDPFSPFLANADSLEFAFDKPTKLHGQLSPRVGISHPISANTVLHLSYGHFFSRPSFFQLSQRQYNSRGRITQLGNSNLKQQKTVAYELGFRQNLWNTFLLTITGFYKDASDQLRSYRVRDPHSGVDYTTLMNADYADIRGIEFSVRKVYGTYISGWIIYTWQVTREGFSGLTSITPTQEVYVTQRRDQYRWFDRRHVINTSINFHVPRGQGPRLFGLRLLSDVELNILYNARSGTPFTAHLEGEDPEAYQNHRWPWQMTTDVKIIKRIGLLGAKVELNVMVRNLFNNKNLVYVGFWSHPDELAYWLKTGDVNVQPDDPNRKWWGNSNEYDFKHYDPPRDFLLGMSILW